MTVVEVVLLGREHGDRRARLLTWIGGLLGGDARTKDQDRDDQQIAGVHGTLRGDRRVPSRQFDYCNMFLYYETNVTTLTWSTEQLAIAMRTTAHADQSPNPTRSRPAARRWLLFVHQLPSHPSNLRVSTWRRLQQLGAIPLKQAVYVLPDTASAREDFEWLKTEVKGAGGDASVFAADNVDAWSDDALVEEFRRSRQDAYADLARDTEDALKRASGARRPRGARAPAIHRLLDIFRERLTAIDGIDFFGSAGRDRVITLLEQLEGHTMNANRVTTTSTPATSGDRAAYQGRLWVTRPRPASIGWPPPG